MKADDCGTQKTANDVMLNHIADHLQFLALLTPRLCTEKLADGNVHLLSSSQASSSGRSAGKRSSLDDDLPEGNGVDLINEVDTDITRLEPARTLTPEEFAFLLSIVNANPTAAQGLVQDIRGRVGIQTNQYVVHGTSIVQ